MLKTDFIVHTQKKFKELAELGDTGIAKLLKEKEENDMTGYDDLAFKVIHYLCDKRVEQLMNIIGRK